MNNSLCGAKIRKIIRNSHRTIILLTCIQILWWPMPSTPNDHNFLNKYTYRCNLSHFYPEAKITSNFLHFKIVSVFKFSSHEQWTISFRLMPCGPWRHSKLHCLWIVWNIFSIELIYIFSFKQSIIKSFSPIDWAYEVLLTAHWILQFSQTEIGQKILQMSWVFGRLICNSNCELSFGAGGLNKYGIQINFNGITKTCINQLIYQQNLNILIIIQIQFFDQLIKIIMVIWLWADHIRMICATAHMWNR